MMIMMISVMTVEGGIAIVSGGLYVRVDVEVDVEGRVDDEVAAVAVDRWRCWIGRYIAWEKVYFSNVNLKWRIIVNF